MVCLYKFKMYDFQSKVKKSLIFFQSSAEESNNKQNSPEMSFQVLRLHTTVYFPHVQTLSHSLLIRYLTIIASHLPKFVRFYFLITSHFTCEIFTSPQCRISEDVR